MANWFSVSVFSYKIGRPLLKTKVQHAQHVRGLTFTQQSVYYMLTFYPEDPSEAGVQSRHPWQRCSL